MATLYRWPAGIQANAAASAVTGVTALTAGTPDPPPVIPGSVLAEGARLVLKASIELTSTSSVPTVTVGFYAGAAGGAIGSAAVLAVTGALAVSATASSWLCDVEYDGTFRATSKSVGVINGFGKSFSWWNVGITGAPTIGIMPQTAAARTVSTLNNRDPVQLDVGVTFSSSVGSISATVTNFWGEVTG